MQTADPEAWVGRTQTLHETLAPVPARALAATLGCEASFDTGSVLPPLWHWLYFLPLTTASEIGPDGHARRGGFLPPVPLPRRMWAGGRFEFRAPLRIGEAVRKTSTIESVQEKTGRSGALVFVTVRHELARADGAEPALVEWHDIVYREAPRPGEPAPAPQTAPQHADWQREWQPDEVLLFRYSALTFNGHRIHYDHPYVTGVEGYPGLVVHGPLIATLLLQGLAEQGGGGAPIETFAFKALRPCFAGRRLLVCGRADGDGVELWAADDGNHLAMSARVRLRTG